MPEARDHTALVRHAAQAGDWRLVQLIAEMLDREPNRPSPIARSAYAMLVATLGLGDPSDYHRG